MKRFSFNAIDKKKIILGVLAVVAIFVWIHRLKTPSRGKVQPGIGREITVSSSPDLQKRQKSRTTYKTWGRNPFVVTETPASGVMGLQLNGIIYGGEEGYALINDQICHVGDEIEGNKVVHIKPDKVILNDGVADFELKLE